MQSINTKQTNPVNAISSKGLRIAIVESQYHHEICTGLSTGAVDAFMNAGGDSQNIIHVHAPGSYELVAIALALAERSDIDAVVALGCVLTGETSHDRYICDAVAHGLVDVTIRTGKPVAFGVLTCITIEQARARSGGSKGNKGIEAMHAAIAATRTIADIRTGSIVARTPVALGASR
jgi:6,7-dimethyl-8-ribityllumazine synthase